jgi:hypothetical protein
MNNHFIGFEHFNELMEIPSPVSSIDGAAMSMYLSTRNGDINIDST